MRAEPNVTASSQVPPRAVARLSSARGTPVDEVPRILIAESDRKPGEDLAAALALEGFELEVADGAQDLMKRIERAVPDVLVMNTALPERSGFAVCRELREAPATCNMMIVMLSYSDSDFDRILALEAGADDVVQGPLYPRELSLRLNAVMRRKRDTFAALDPDERVLTHGDLRIDLDRHLVEVAGEAVPLSEREFAILSFLVSRPGRLLTREEILREVVGSAEGRTPRVVDTHVKSIRRKLRSAGSIIETLRGAGYRTALKHEEG